MNMQTCDLEQDVLQLVAIDQWPRQAGAALVAHVETCSCCRDVVLVTTALRRAPERDAALPNPSVVWQHAQLQARQEAVRRAMQPVAAARVVAAVAIGVSILFAVTWLMARTPDAGGVSTADRWGSLLTGIEAAGTSMVAAAAAGVTGGYLWGAAAAVTASVLVIGVAVGVSALADLTGGLPGRR
jgi:hypothetical protein